MSSVWVEIKNGVVTWVSPDSGNAAYHNQLPGCHAERYIHHKEAAKRIRELEKEAGARVELADLLERWVRSGCPDCGGDCSSANPPVVSCIVHQTLSAIAKTRGER